LIAVVYIGFVALAQRDMKKLIAYSSIAHMGFVTLGAFVGFQIVSHTGKMSGIEFGLDGAVVQMLSHGLVSGAMFLCVGVMYDRVHSREISAYGGVVNTMPKFAAFMVLFALANAGVPGTSGFVGEFLVILASFKANVWYAFLAGTTLILGSAYTLWLVKRVIFGEIANDHVRELTDLNGREFLVLGMLAIAVLLVGLWPAPLLDAMRVTTQHLAQQILVSKIVP
jgi:NADH-quinone oxidoreductase subunit M